MKLNNMLLDIEILLEKIKGKGKWKKHGKKYAGKLRNKGTESGTKRGIVVRVKLNGFSTHRNRQPSCVGRGALLFLE